MTSRSITWGLTTTTLLVLLLLLSQSLSRPVNFERMDAAGASSIPTPRPKSVPGRVAFVGDSYTIGAGGQGERWTTILAQKHEWDEVNLGLGGTGYVPQSYGDAYKFKCSQRHCPSYLDQVDTIRTRRVETVFVSGGRNDVRASAKAVDLHTRLVFETLHEQVPDARVYVLSPFWGSGTYPKWLKEHAAIIKKNAIRSGFTYLEVGHPLENRPELIYKDHVHPTGAGYQLLASTVDAKYRAVTR